MKILIALAAALLATGASAQMQPSNGNMQPMPQQQPMSGDMHNGDRPMTHDMHSDRMHREMRSEHRMMRHDDNGRHMGWHKRKVCSWSWRYHHRVKTCRWVRR